MLDPPNRRALILEAKKADSEAGMKRACDEALKQIIETRYADSDSFYGYRTVLCYGAAFYKKSALVRKG